jgi:pimeloyl-ACP methyl ester carboxylesterase
MSRNRSSQRIHRLFSLLLLLSVMGVCCAPLSAIGQEKTNAPTAPPSFGTNAAAGAYANVNGIKLYYEVYGSGTPLLMIHGNGGNIASMSQQIAYFMPQYQVVVADSRGHGKSQMGEGRLTYEQMAEDLNSLLELRKLKSVYVLGWSDGGILGLLLAIHHPDKVGKLAIMGANLNPEGAYDWALEMVAQQSKMVEEKIASGDKAPRWQVMKQYLDLLGKQPHIPVSDLHQITAPTLVMAGDKDVIRGEHTLQIFENIPHAHLCIFPGATHLIPIQNAPLFNRTVALFFEKPFTRPDTKDLFK